MSGRFLRTIRFCVAIKSEFVYINIEKALAAADQLHKCSKKASVSLCISFLFREVFFFKKITIFCLLTVVRDNDADNSVVVSDDDDDDDDNDGNCVAVVSDEDDDIKFARKKLRLHRNADSRLFLLKVWRIVVYRSS